MGDADRRPSQDDVGGKERIAGQPKEQMSDRRIIRVFPRATKATPRDALAVVGRAPDWFDEADEIHVSVTFSWDLGAAESLAKAWKSVAPVKIGGPAVGARGGAFEPGMYLADGYIITTRGCPNRCWFCDVWKREGPTRELPIKDGWNVLDSNLLAANEAHIRAVFAMLARQTRRVEFTGGLEAARLKPWHVDLLSGLHPRPAVWLAYDEDRDLEPLQAACRMLLDAGWTRESHRLRCYVLAGYPGDTQAAASERCRTALAAGCTPMAMIYRGPEGEYPEGWGPWQRRWVRPACIHAADSRYRIAKAG